MATTTKKRVLTAQDQQRLRSVLQAATIAALMDSRRWEPGDIAFQGGTSLHLAHGSARFSEDLDFMVRGGLSLDGLSKEVKNRLRLPIDVPTDLVVSVTPCKEERKPHMFYVTLSGPQVVGSVKVKIELWQTQSSALQSLQLMVSTVSSTAGQAFVPTLTLPELFADKVYALGGRNRIKARDVFDLWWLQTKEKMQLSEQSLLSRLDIYPLEGGDAAATAKAWLSNAQERLAELRAPGSANVVEQDLKRWLPSSYPVTEKSVLEMLSISVEHLESSINMMRDLHIQFDPEELAPARDRETQ